ncbi:Sec-independent protein translocase subunit TatA [Angustibacter luteus]|uniref:Sec-independent protein translocase protein TatA n=1 Tax=Angustibacter luteus TaxID=658456 RepID=A0ABW1J9M7_9ACTN
MRALEPWHLIVLLVVVLILFGGKRLPDAARGLGRSMRIFKSEVKQMHDDDTPAKPTSPVEGRIVEPPAPPRATPPADVRTGEQRDSSA